MYMYSHTYMYMYSTCKHVPITQYTCMYMYMYMYNSSCFSPGVGQEVKEVGKEGPLNVLTGPTPHRQVCRHGGREGGRRNRTE